MSKSRETGGKPQADQTAAGAEKKRAHGREQRTQLLRGRLALVSQKIAKNCQSDGQSSGN